MAWLLEIFRCVIVIQTNSHSSFAMSNEIANNSGTDMHANICLCASFY